MPLDVYLVLPIRGGANASRRHVAAFDWNGEYAYLCRFWPKVATRGAIDLYGDALFRGEHLSGLHDALVRTQDALRSRPKQWTEHLGDQIKPTKKPIYDVVDRSAVERHVVALLGAVDEAAAQHGAIEFAGD